MAHISGKKSFRELFERHQVHFDKLLSSGKDLTPHAKIGMINLITLGVDVITNFNNIFIAFKVVSQFLIGSWSSDKVVDAGKTYQNGADGAHRVPGKTFYR
jgi:hypothetical protein